MIIPKTHPSIYRSRNSVQIGLSIIEPVCTLFFSVNYFSVGRLFPLPSALLSTGLERWKVFGLNTLRRWQILPETTCRQTFQLSNLVCTTFADELRKWSSVGMEMLIENWATPFEFVCDLSTPRPLAFSCSRIFVCSPAMRFVIVWCLGLELIHTVLLLMKICWFDE